MTNDNTSAMLLGGEGGDMDYELTFVVSGVSVDDDDAVEALEAIDAMLFRGGGVDLLTVTGTGSDAVRAALQAATEAVSASPRLRVLRLDRNLVGIPEIAERSGRSRQNVAQWVRGERQGAGTPFPLPEGTAGRSMVWLWSEVNTWLRALGLDDGLHHPTRTEMALIDHALITSVTVPLTFDAPDDDLVDERRRIAEAFERPHAVGILQQLAEQPGTRDAEGRHVILLATPSESAASVLARMVAHGHDVVLATTTDAGQLLAVGMSTQPLTGPKELVPVPAGATVRDWVELMWARPNAAFVLSDTARATPGAVFRDAA
ncbi:helix-turn-helix transcriptional regulator [Streptomyces sp. NPDC021224]|uniref:helix-turn-helix transcriptional regulator n=1 Tax=unclassified Streptomyces TaxID=2593676 RepID=UPI003794B899